MVKTKKDSVDLTNYPIIERILRKRIDRMKTLDRLNDAMGILVTCEIFNNPNKQDDKIKYEIIAKLSELISKFSEDLYM